MPHLILLGLLLIGGVAEARVIHSERSLYRNILVTDEHGERCLRFSVRRLERNQSCMLLDDPERIVFPYVRMMLAALLLDPDPGRILIVGLGGGTLPRALQRLLPKASIDIVEIDPAVVAVAERYFGFRSGPKMRVVTADARVFVKRAFRRGDRYDLIMLDAFGGDYIPEHLMTKEFLEEVRGLLTADGVLAANTFATSRLYDYESVTYQNVFKYFFNVKTDISNNRVILTRRSGLPGREVLERRAAEWRGRMRRLHVDIRRMPARMRMQVDWDPTAPPLTDQYSPANLLK